MNAWFKTIHWRAREAAEWAVIHGAPETFTLDLNERHNGRPSFRKATLSELMGRMADPAWRLVNFTWAPDVGRNGAVTYYIDLLPASLMSEFSSKDLMHYGFEMPVGFDFHESLRKKRSKKP